MKTKILKVLIVAIIVLFVAAFNFNFNNKNEKENINTDLKSLVSQAQAQSESGSWCLAAYTTTRRDGVLITYLRYDYYWCDGSHTWVSGWWWN
jgi:hypothetical protein